MGPSHTGFDLCPRCYVTRTAPGPGRTSFVCTGDMHDFEYFDSAATAPGYTSEAYTCDYCRGGFRGPVLHCRSCTGALGGSAAAGGSSARPTARSLATSLPHVAGPGGGGFDSCRTCYIARHPRRPRIGFTCSSLASHTLAYFASAAAYYGPGVTYGCDVCHVRGNSGPGYHCSSCTGAFALGRRVPSRRIQRRRRTQGPCDRVELAIARGAHGRRASPRRCAALALLLAHRTRVRALN